MKIACVDMSLSGDVPAWNSWVDAKGRFAMPATGLLSIASMVGEDDDVELIDERVDTVPDTVDADVVAMSFKTMDSRKAYRLGDTLRAAGKTVVMGGVHASAMAEEAAAHADVVVAGEGEAVWPVVLADIKAGAPEKIYRAPSTFPLNQLPRQRVELVNHPRYMLHAMQTARGCSFDCEFCPTRAIFGDGFRLRNVDAVMAEVEALLDIDDKPVFFTENVFGAGDLPFITELTGRLKVRGVRYGVICDWFMLSEGIVQRLAEGGCGLICLNLTGRMEAREIAALEYVRKAGIAIWGYFMFGFEEDTPDVFQRAVDRFNTYDIRSASLTVLTPFPGTPMGERLAREGRIFSRDLDRYDHMHVHFAPKQMSAEELQAGFDYVCREVGDKLHFEGAVDALYHS